MSPKTHEYINDLPKAIHNTNVYMYTDDTSLSYQNHSIQQLNRALNQDLKALDKWLRGNKLSLNVAKTQSMVISTKQKFAVWKTLQEHVASDLPYCTL